MSQAAGRAAERDRFFEASLERGDPDVHAGIRAELQRQQRQIELIASENIVSRAVLEAQGSVLTNKYAEGYPGRRYYGGCEFVDEVERLAIERAKRLFGCTFANVQPHSGANANQAVFFALLNPGDTFLGMDLACGGHLTHGSPVNISGKWFHPVAYGVREDDHLIDYDQVAEIAQREKPKLIIAGGSAYSRHIDFARFRQIADDIGAILMVDMAHYAGLIAGGIAIDPETLRETWRATIDGVFAEATLAVPGNDWMQKGGRTGTHTEHLGHLLSELQSMQRTFPNATW